MSNTTSIQDLPVDPSGGSNENVTLTANENGPPTTGAIPPPIGHQSGDPSASAGPPGGTQLDNSNINSIVSGLQQAAMNGATQLPSRDIPVTSSHISQDEQIQPNYIPETNTTDYIDEEDDDVVMDAYNSRANKEDMLNQTYDEFQTPFLLAILFFLFQLPFFKKYLLVYLPMLFLSDGNYNLYGYLISSVLFGIIYYLLAKGISLTNMR